MSTSRVEAKRAERRIWSNHKAYLRRRGMHSQPKKEYHFVPFKPFSKPDPLALTAPVVKIAKLGLWARLVKWLKGR